MPLKPREGQRSVLRALGSLWFAAVLLVLLVVAMACATVFESARGTEQALAAFYHSWWFESLLGLVGVNVLAALLLRFPFSGRQVGFVLTHTAILVTFAGALVTKHLALEGQIGMVKGQTVDHFTVDHDTLTVKDLQDQKRAVADLSGCLGGRFRPGEVRAAPLLSVGDLRVEVIRYLPDSEWESRVLNDSPTRQPAIEVSLSPTGRDDPDWVFASHPAEVGGVEVSLRLVADRAELGQLLDRGATSRAASKGTVRIERGGETFEFPMEEGLDRPVPLGETGYTARVLRYLPHATVGSDGQVVGASERPVNPYIEVELVGPGVRETRRAFAKFPDFGAMHGLHQEELGLTFVAAPADAPATPVEVLSGPDGELHARFSHRGTDVVTRKLEVGTAVDTPWRGHKFAVLRRYENARIERSLDPIEPVREVRRPAILLRLVSPKHTSESWLQKYRHRLVTIEGTSYDVAYADRSVPLGFSLTLDRFHIGHYPGERRPRSFESHVTATDPNTGRSQSRVVSMNHPASFGGYALHQSSYREEGGQTASFLSVSRDPGQPIVFAGYIGLLIGMLVVLGTRLAEGRRNRRRTVSAGLTAAAVLLVSAPSSAAELPDSLDLTIIRGLAVQHDGRWPPLDTVARDVVESVTGDAFHGGHDPVLLLLAWTFDSQRWASEPLISVSSAELRSELRLPASRAAFSYAELAGHRHLHTLMGDLAEVEGRKLNPLESKVGQIREKLFLLERVFGNRVIRPVPDPEDVVGRWSPIAAPRDGPDDAEALNAAWAALGKAFLANDAPAFAEASQRLTDVLGALPAAHQPDPQLIATELRYNRLRPFRMTWIVMVFGTGLAAAAMFVRRRCFDMLVVLTLIAAFYVLVYGLSQRWEIAGRIPAANMYESLLLLSWGAAAFTIVTTLTTGALTLGSSAFSFKGRIGRETFWFTFLVLYAFNAVVQLTATMLLVDPGDTGSTRLLGFAVLSWIISIPLLWVALATHVKRWHDRGKSGWMVLVSCIPVVGWIWAIIELGFLKGSIGTNQYGPDSLADVSVQSRAAQETLVASGIQRRGFVALTAAAVATLALILADCLPLDHYVRPIPPVLLDTVWMSIHVPVIMVSYSVLTLAVLIAHVQLVVMAVAPGRRELAGVIDSLHYWYLHVGSVLLLAGIVTGSMWGASSWGRYWGWDPKEVWSLIAFLGYMAILHVRVDRQRMAWWMYSVAALLGVGLFVLVIPKLAPLSGLKLLGLGAAAAAMVVFVLGRGRFATAVKSILAFWLIVMTYVGVNYVLGIGLHSYGFGTGAVVRYMFLIGGVDLALITVCCVVYLVLRPSSRSPAGGVPVGSPG